MTPRPSRARSSGNSSVRPPGRRSGRPSGRGWGLAALATGALAAVLALAVAPAEAIQGEPQRLMYVHVPGAWLAFVAFAVVSLASCADLLRPSRRWAAVALGSAELGVAMTALTLLEGSIWGHSAWGVWWTWDPRLMTTALLLVLGIAYLALRALPGDTVRTVHRADVAGLAFAGLVPLVHVSVLWWRTLHQPPTLLRPDLSPPIAPLMLLALMTSLVAFLLGGAWYVHSRVLQLVPRGSVAGGSDADRILTVDDVLGSRVTPPSEGDDHRATLGGTVTS